VATVSRQRGNRGGGLPPLFPLMGSNCLAGAGITDGQRADGRLLRADRSCSSMVGSCRSLPNACAWSEGTYKRVGGDKWLHSNSG
jgi:hypothetical protein